MDIFYPMKKRLFHKKTKKKTQTLKIPEPLQEFLICGSVLRKEGKEMVEKEVWA